jgi:hypothetical protein
LSSAIKHGLSYTVVLHRTVRRPSMD